MKLISNGFRAIFLALAIHCHMPLFLLLRFSLTIHLHTLKINWLKFHCCANVFNQEFFNLHWNKKNKYVKFKILYTD